MTKDEAKKLILDLAARNGGKVSFRNFVQEAGIPEQRLRKAEWFPGWNALLKELGIATDVFHRPRTPEDEVASAVANLIVRFGRWPTEDEFVREKKVSNVFPDVRIIRRAKRSGTLWSILQSYNADDPAYEVVRKLAVSQQPDYQVEDVAYDTERVHGHVYMMKAGRRYKIGYTNSPTRRHREVSVNVPDRTDLVHTIETDDPRGIEDYWHRRFAGKRVRGTEWFELDADDVRAFKRRKYQ
jgi:hypothetical protein